MYSIPFSESKKKLFANLLNYGIDKINDPLDKTTHSQVDFGLIQGTWKNCFNNAEADSAAALQTAHNPIFSETISDSLEHVGLKLFKNRNTFLIRQNM